MSLAPVLLPPAQDARAAAAAAASAALFGHTVAVTRAADDGVATPAVMLVAPTLVLAHYVPVGIAVCASLRVARAQAHMASGDEDDPSAAWWAENALEIPGESAVRPNHISFKRRDQFD